MDTTYLEQNGTMFIKKEEFIEEYRPETSLSIKEEVASICDDEQGYIFDSIFDNEEIKKEPDTKCDSDQSSHEDKVLLNVDNIDLDYIPEDKSRMSTSDLHERKRLKQSKSRAKGKVKFSRKTKESVPKRERLRRDEMFKTKEYFCSLCKKCYIGLKCFRKHLKNHFTFHLSQYACPICTYTTSHVFHINRHILETHFLQDQEDEKLFACTWCDKRFVCQNYLNNHMLIHTDNRFYCSHCDYSCSKKNRLESHLFSVHGYTPMSERASKFTSKNKVSPLICNYCNYSCKEKAVLRKHIQRHMNEKQHKCPDCNYSCNEQGDLNKHRTIHSDDRPFVCNDCKKAFKRRSHLIIHFNQKYSCSGKKNKRKVKK